MERLERIVRKCGVVFFESDNSNKSSYMAEYIFKAIDESLFKTEMERQHYLAATSGKDFIIMFGDLICNLLQRKYGISIQE